MKITVITVCFNAVQTIEQTILSVISQTYPHIEYIVVDGASTDGTLEIVEKYKERISCIISEPDKGVYDAMNKGIKLATGDWINFMNAGDCFHDSGVCQSVMDRIVGQPTIVYGSTFMKYYFGELIKKPFPIQELTWHMVFIHQSCFIQAAYQKAHLFNTCYKITSDYDLFHRAYRDEVAFCCLDLVISDYEASYGISSSNFLSFEKEMADINGIHRDPAWGVRLYIRYCWDCIKQRGKRLLPSAVVLKVKKWKNSRNIA